MTVRVGTWRQTGMVLEQQVRAHILIYKKEREREEEGGRESTNQACCGLKAHPMPYLFHKDHIY